MKHFNRQAWGGGGRILLLRSGLKPPGSLTESYECFGETYWLHFQGVITKLEITSSSETMVNTSRGELQRQRRTLWCMRGTFCGAGKENCMLHERDILCCMKTAVFWAVTVFSMVHNQNVREGRACSLIEVIFSHYSRCPTQIGIEQWC
jgi:hypothetical protein